MNTRKLMLITLVVVGAITATGVVTVTAQSSDTTTGESDVSTPDPDNYTRLYVEDSHQHVDLKPGESDTLTVTVENGDDESVDVSPQLVSPPGHGQQPVESSWVSVDSDDTTLEADESREFEIDVDVPDDAEIGDYAGTIAFTDETVQYPGRPPQPIHSVSLNVEVWQEPTVQIESDTHIYTQLKAGETMSREITVSNTGEEAVPVAPQFNAENTRRHGPTNRETLDRSWVSIDGPSEIEPGETETVEITVEPPAAADRGDYSGTVDLGITDPARPDDSAYWQQVDLNFQLWTEPDEPFETTFDVSEETTEATLQLDARQPRASDAGGNADFEVTFISPDGEEIKAERASLTDSGHVDLGAQRRPAGSDDTYAADGGQQRFTYELDDPAAGEWSVRIDPKNTMGFQYEFTRSEDD